MKKQFIALFVFAGLLGQAQEFKIKGSRIAINKEVIALVSNKKALYTISSPGKVPQFTVEVKQALYDNGDFDYWYEVTDLATGKKTEIEYLKLTEGFLAGFEKNLVANLIKGTYPLLSQKGIDTALLREITDAGTAGQSERFKAKGQKITAAFDDAAALYKKQKMAVDRLGTIFRNNAPVGRISRNFLTDPINNTYVNYTVTDALGAKVAEYQEYGGLNPETNFYLRQEILTADRKVFKLKTDKIGASSSIENDRNAMNIIAVLLYNGYELNENMPPATINSNAILSTRHH